MPLFDINEFGASDAQIGGFGFGSQPLKSTFINIDRQRQTSIAAASKLKTLSVPVRSYYF